MLYMRGRGKLLVRRERESKRQVRDRIVRSECELKLRSGYVGGGAKRTTNGVM